MTAAGSRLAEMERQTVILINISLLKDLRKLQTDFLFLVLKSKHRVMRGIYIKLIAVSRRRKVYFLKIVFISIFFPTVKTDSYIFVKLIFKLHHC